jgi:hypothetical protein
MTLEWQDLRWVIVFVLIAVLTIMLDEWAYAAWRKYNPGHMYSHLDNKTIPLVDPFKPPSTY